MSDDVRTARALGELSANLAALGRSIDTLRSEAASRDGGLQAQITEVANQQRDALQTNAVLAERLTNHIAVDETNHRTMLLSIGEVNAKLATLVTWRGKVLGALAVLGIFIALLGNLIGGMASTLWHSIVR